MRKRRAEDVPEEMKEVSPKLDAFVNKWGEELKGGLQLTFCADPKIEHSPWEAMIA